MYKPEYQGAIKFTPKYGKCDPIIIRGDWTYNIEKDRWTCSNAAPDCYNGIPLAGECCEMINN